MQAQVVHETRYDYVPAVEVAQHMAYLQPLTTKNQRLLSHTLRVLVGPWRALTGDTAINLLNACFRRAFQLVCSVNFGLWAECKCHLHATIVDNCC